MPKRPMTATMKLKPPISGVRPKVRRSSPLTMSMPTEAMMKPNAVATSVLTGDFPTRPTKALKVRSMTPKTSGGPKRRAKAARSGREERQGDRAEHGAAKVRKERGAERPSGLALLGHGIPIEGGGHRPRLAGNVEEDRADAASVQRPPVDGGEQDHGRHRGHDEGHGDQDGAAVGPAEAGQDADDDAEDEPGGRRP